uniref:Uncharacterized protein n=2 Tax=Phlebotomus papatasi TaxID=29031 RepID=A0A1B0DGB2_PHLPP
VSGLQCYVCDSTDLNYGEYNYCDTRYCEENVGYLETCEDVELTDENVNQADLVCYRTVFFHKDDGYVIMRGCSTKNICSVLQQNATALDNDAIAIPTECQTCNEDFCDPQQSS